MRASPVIFVAAILLILGGYKLYEYLKFNPPTALIETVTRMEPPPPLPDGDSAPLTPPPGFRATIFSRDVPGARVMVRDPKNTLLVSSTREGKIFALPNHDADGIADSTVTVLEGLRQPHGILVLCPETGFESADQDACTLYVAETNALTSYRYDADTLRATERRILAELPSGGGHFTRTIMLHPDGKRMLISVGSSCNVCHEDDARRAAVLSYDMLSGAIAPFATGLRNTVFMMTDPVTGDIWGTDNGRDLIGDDIPPDEINILKEGGRYGWPLCYGDNAYDEDFDGGERDTCSGMTPPHLSLQAHSAALGLTFVPEEGWPEDMWLDLLVAYHGSWNRSEPTGYKVVRFDLDHERNVVGGPHDFLTGFLAPGADADEAIGRPVDLLIEPGGVLFVTDDRAGAVYRITRNDLSE